LCYVTNGICQKIGKCIIQKSYRELAEPPIGLVSKLGVILHIKSSLASAKQQKYFEYQSHSNILSFGKCGMIQHIFLFPVPKESRFDLYDI
jgi:hypothetical protein